jgi:toxin HigB-1
LSKIFKDAITESVADGICPKGFPADLLRVARRKLALVRAANKLEDLKSPPGNRLHPLIGDRAGCYAIRINDQYRVCFRWTEAGARDIEVTDYH